MIYPNKYYRHYKGGLYKVLMLGKCTETNETLVIYSKYNDVTVWVRPLHIFEEEVLPGIRRFRMIDENSTSDF